LNFTDTFDLNIDWKHAMSSPIDVSFFVTNLTDATYKIGGASLIASSLGIDQAIYNEPRTLGVQIRYAFGPGR